MSPGPALPSYKTPIICPSTLKTCTRKRPAVGRVTGTVTDVEEITSSGALPGSFTLGQPYPNPFNPSVTVPITLPHKGRLRVQVFNVLGQAVGVLYDAKAGPGDLNVIWDAADFPSGVYFFKVVFNDLPKTVSAVLVK